MKARRVETPILGTSGPEHLLTALENLVGQSGGMPNDTFRQVIVGHITFVRVPALEGLVLEPTGHYVGDAETSQGLHNECPVRCMWDWPTKFTNNILDVPSHVLPKLLESGETTRRLAMPDRGVGVT